MSVPNLNNTRQSAIRVHNSWCTVHNKNSTWWFCNMSCEIKQYITCFVSHTLAFIQSQGLLSSVHLTSIDLTSNVLVKGVINYSQFYFVRSKPIVKPVRVYKIQFQTATLLQCVDKTTVLYIWNLVTGNVYHLKLHVKCDTAFYRKV